MERIRQINKDGKTKYEVLITPNSVSSPTNAIMLGDWLYYHDDTALMNYSIQTFKTLNEAMETAYKYPPIRWDKMILDNIDAFYAVSKILTDNLVYNRTVATFNKILLSPEQLKNTMFNKISNLGKDFSMFYDIDTVFAFDIVQPWKINIKRTQDQLMSIPELNIIKTIETPTHIKLIGINPSGVSYSIRLWLTIYYNCMFWGFNNDIPKDLILYQFKKLIKSQNILDQTPIQF